MIGTDALWLVAKASILTAAALAAAHLLRRHPAISRHRLWSATFLALLALPALIMLLPELPIRIPGWRAAPPVVGVAAPAELSGQTTPRAQPTTAVTAPNIASVAHPEDLVAPIGRALPSAGEALLMIWLTGAGAALLALAVAFGRVARLRAGARELDDADWRERCTRAAQRLGYTRNVRVLASAAVTTPMAGGVTRPAVFVPPSATHWDAGRRDIVIAHEIAHLASADPLRKLVSNLACALYWFHPLVWLARRQAATDCERACDEAVLTLGVRPSAYAQTLLDFACAARGRETLAVALVPIVRRSRLEERLTAILQSPARPHAGRRGLIHLLAPAILTVSLAAARPAASLSSFPATALPSPDAFAAPANAIGSIPATPESAQPTPVAVSDEVVLTSTSTVSGGTLNIAQSPGLAADCWSTERGGSFVGSITQRGTTIHEQIGTRGTERVIQTRFGDLAVCMIAEGVAGERETKPSDWVGRAPRVILETRLGGDTRRMEAAGGSTTWQRNGTTVPPDVSVAQWREALLGVLDVVWDLSKLHGQVSALRGRISAIHGERSALQGEISALRGQASGMRGQISGWRAHESALRSQISDIRAHESTLRASISSERAMISSLQAARAAGGSDSEVATPRIRQHEDRIRRIEAELARYDGDSRVREVERSIAELDLSGKIAALEREIDQFDGARVAEIERRIAGLDVAGRVRAIEAEIATLVPGRSRALEAERDERVARLRSVLGR